MDTFALVAKQGPGNTGNSCTSTRPVTLSQPRADSCDSLGKYAEQYPHALVSYSVRVGSATGFGSVSFCKLSKVRSIQDTVMVTMNVTTTIVAKSMPARFE